MFVLFFVSKNLVCVFIYHHIKARRKRQKFLRDLTTAPGWWQIWERDTFEWKKIATLLLNVLHERTRICPILNHLPHFACKLVWPLCGNRRKFIKSGQMKLKSCLLGNCKPHTCEFHTFPQTIAIYLTELVICSPLDIQTGSSQKSLVVNVLPAAIQSL